MVCGRGAVCGMSPYVPNTPALATHSPAQRGCTEAAPKAEVAAFVPVFASDELSSPECTPFFFDPRDFLATWVSAGLPAEKTPNELTVAPLEKLVGMMLEGAPGRDWRAAIFIPSEERCADGDDL